MSSEIVVLIFMCFVVRNYVDVIHNFTYLIIFLLISSAVFFNIKLDNQ